MTFVQARNAIISGLEAHVGCPITLSDQIAEKPDYPYGYYSVLTPRRSDHAFGLEEIQYDGENSVKTRSEPVTATMSFTFCSMNREIEDGYVFGEDEAFELAEKAYGFFLLNGHNISTKNGHIVINNVGDAVSRTGFLVEDSVRRYGFDVRFSYVRTDEMPTTTVLRPEGTAGNLHP